MKRRTGGGVALTLAIALTQSAAAGADAPPVATQADALFAEAKSLRGAAKYPEACAKFAASDRLAPGIGVALYLADCYEHTGKTASAWRAFRDAEERALARKDDRARVAAARAEALEPALRRVAITVARSLRRPGVTVWLDGRGPIAPAPWPTLVPVDPGDHVIALKLGERIARTVPVHVATGGTDVSVALDEPPLSLSLKEERPPLAPAPEEHAIDSRTGVELGLVVLGVTGAAAGAAFLAAKNSSLSTGAPNGAPVVDEKAATASTLAFAVGGAALAAAVVVYVTTPTRKAAALSISPLPLVGGAGASLQASF